MLRKCKSKLGTTRPCICSEVNLVKSIYFRISTHRNLTCQTVIPGRGLVRRYRRFLSCSVNKTDFRMDLSYSAWQNCQNAEFEQTFEVSNSVQPSALDLYNLRPSNEPRNAKLWIHANIIETKPGSERLYNII